MRSGCENEGEAGRDGASPRGDIVAAGGRLRILVGHAPDRLRDLPDESVQCVVTSPPYWGLRDYGTEPQVWGGDPSCGHTWISAPQRARRKQVSGSKQGRSAGSPRDRITTAVFCESCGAWRGSLGHEPTPELYVEHLVRVFREVRRVLRKDGTAWLVIGDCYAGYWGKKYAHKPFGQDRSPDVSTVPSKPSPDFRRSSYKPKDLVGVPWRVALALQADGWWLRSDIIWQKPNPMPESVRDRPTKAHEYIFLLTRDKRYFFDREAVKEPGSQNSHGGGMAGMHRKHRRTGGGGHSGLDRGKPAGRAGRNIRSVWTITPRPFPGAHFATFPETLPERCINAGTSEKGCCPRCGAPWRRVLGKARRAEGRGSGNKRRKLRHERGGLDDHFGSSVPWSPTVADTIGWQPSCDCDAGDPAPCVVLDPFLGSGTTGLVALELGRAVVGLELNPEYAEMALQRIEETAPLTLAAITGGAGRPGSGAGR